MLKGLLALGGCGMYGLHAPLRAGAPAATEKAGMSLVTTEFAPITHRSPIVTPLVTTTFAPHQIGGPPLCRAGGCIGMSLNGP